MEDMFDDITVVDWDAHAFALTKFPGRDGIRQGPQTESLLLGLFLQTFPCLAFRSGAGVRVNPGEAGSDQLFVEAGATIGINQRHRLPKLVLRPAFAVKGDRFHLYDFSRDRLGSELLCLVAKILTCVRGFDPVEPNAFLFPFVLDRDGVTVSNADNLVLPGVGWAATKEAGKKNGEKDAPISVA